VVQQPWSYTAHAYLAALVVAPDAKVGGATCLYGQFLNQGQSDLSFTHNNNNAP
jgi:hypothetical protein